MHAIIGQDSTRSYRVVRHKNDWTLKEHEIVVSHWPDLETIEKILPHRTRIAIKGFAGRCNLRKPRHVWTTLQDKILKERVRDFVPKAKIAAELGLSARQVGSRMSYTKQRYGRRKPKLTGHPQMDAILQRAYELNMSRHDVDVLCCSGKSFATWKPKKRIAYRHIWRAARELGGTLTITWSDL